MRAHVAFSCLALGALLSQAKAANRDKPAAATEKTFMAIHFVSGQYPRQESGAYGEFTETGGVREETLKPLPSQVRHVVIDPKSKTMFGITSHEFVLIDPLTKAKTKLTPPKALPELSWTCGLAYDSKRERIVIATLGGVGHLYSYDPAAKSWELIGDLDNVDLSCLTYDAYADRFYGFGKNHRIEGAYAVMSYNGKGALIESVGIRGMPIDRGGNNVNFHFRPLQMVYHDKKLLMVDGKTIRHLDLMKKEAIVTFEPKP